MSQNLSGPNQNNEIARLRDESQRIQSQLRMAEQGRIDNIMSQRRNRQNAIARGESIPETNSGMRNDNDMNILDRSELLTGSQDLGNNLGMNSNSSNSTISSSRDNNNNNNFMALFDENYYLNNSRTSKSLVSGNVDLMNANGGMNEQLHDNRKLDRNELLKKKALDLETLIVDRLTRDKVDDARRVFSVLQKMHNKYDDDIVSDVYYRVLQGMPKEKRNGSSDIYSYRNNKNNFKEVLKNLNSKNDIKAFNEGNTCISSLGAMFEECDLNICTDKCKDKIMKAKEESEKDECKKLITGHRDGEDLKMKDDIKSTILERLKYCKKVADLKKGNFDMISYSDKVDLKQKIIEEIQEMSRLANMHYSSCHDKASKLFSEDPKFKSILNILRDIDFHELSLERLQEIRNDLSTLPTCSMLKYQEHDKNREDDVKDGIRVGKYIIPKKTDYYDQIQGKDRPFVYRDIATDNHYLYDSYSKTLTPFEYPMTQDSLEKQMELDAKYDKKELNEKYLGPSEYSGMYDINFEPPNPSLDSNLSPAPEETVEFPAPSVDELERQADSNLNKELENMEKQSNKTVLGNLTSKNVIEYLFLIIVVAIILAVFASL